MVPGLDPMEAVDRLKKFQQLFEVHFCFYSSDFSAQVRALKGPFFLFSYFVCARTKFLCFEP